MLMLIIIYLGKNVFLKIVVAPKGYIELSNIKTLIALNFVLNCFSAICFFAINSILGLEYYLSTRIKAAEWRGKIIL